MSGGGERVRRPAGEVVDGLGVAVRLASDDLVEAAVLIVKVVDSDGDVHQRICWSPNMSWIERRGMLEAARDVERCSPADMRP